jgi:hypothetical protein
MNEVSSSNRFIGYIIPLKTLRNIFLEGEELERKYADPICFPVGDLIVGRLSQFKAEITRDMGSKEDFLVVFDDWPHPNRKLIIKKVNCFSLRVFVQPE